jgi:predicted ATP-grasp superfamily ATP-dependent carboligase
MSVTKTVLVIAYSARALSQMAVDAGYNVVAIDCFGDVDTRRLTLRSVVIPHFQLSVVADAMNAMMEIVSVDAVLFGAGFEQQPASLHYLQQHFPVLGVEAACFCRLNDKSDFFESLQQLQIPYPATRFELPLPDSVGLLKPLMGQGGVGIDLVDATLLEIPDGYYWQQRVAGEAFSVLFVGHVQGVSVLGFNRQWTRCASPEHEYVFAGIANQALLPDSVKQLVSQWLMQLSTRYRLRGLGSLDFMVGEQGCFCLEVNARVPASAQLYGRQILSVHAAACTGQIIDLDDFSFDAAAYQLLYANQTVQIPADMAWPDWVVDIPDTGAIVEKDQPLCSIICRDNSPDAVAQSLLRRTETLTLLLEKQGLLHALPR